MSDKTKVVTIPVDNSGRRAEGEYVGREEVVDPPEHPVPNARRFAGARYRHMERSILVHQGGQFYVWNGRCWPDLDDAGLRAELYGHFEHAVYYSGAKSKRFAPNRYKVADLIDALRAVTHLSVSQDTPSWLDGCGLNVPANELIPCENGLVHWPTRTLYGHTPTYYTHHSVAFKFQTDAPEPVRWLTFMRDLWGDDIESIETLQEVFGYLVSGDTRLQKMFLVVGPRRSGKGTIARIIKAMLGAHNVAGPTLAGIATNFGVSPLIGKPVAIIADARLKTSDTSVVTERLLSISGEDTLTVDRKYKEPWTGQIPARIMLLTNELPRLTDSSGAMASRFIVLQMLQSFYGRENFRLTDELIEELPGIFNWALNGLERLRERGYFRQPESSQEAIRELEDLGSPVGAFIREECVVGPEHCISVDGLYQAWRDWCESAGRNHPTTAQVFGRDLRSAVPGIGTIRPRDDNGKRHREYQGIGLVRSGPRPSSMYSSVDPVSTDGRNGVDRGPSWTTCSSCDGEGCRYCGDTGRNPATT